MIIREASIAYGKEIKVDSVAFDGPEKIAKAAKEYLRTFDPEKEHVCAISLNRKNKLKSIFHISTGSLSASIVNPREVFKPLVLDSAAAFVLFHNHPSGDPAPSRGDIQITRQLREASKIMGIVFLDHVIIGEEEEDPCGQGIYSFNDAGLI